MATQSAHESHFGDPSTGSTIYISIIGVLIFVLTVIYLETLYYTAEEHQRIEKIVNEPVRSLELLREQQADALNTYAYDHAYNDSAGRVTIPIDDATRRLLEEWPNPKYGFTPPVTAGSDAGGSESTE